MQVETLDQSLVIAFQGTMGMEEAASRLMRLKNRLYYEA